VGEGTEKQGCSDRGHQTVSSICRGLGWQKIEDFLLGQRRAIQFKRICQALWGTRCAAVSHSAIQPPTKWCRGAEESNRGRHDKEYDEVQRIALGRGGCDNSICSELITNQRGSRENPI
jgi:hypothetical protein